MEKREVVSLYDDVPALDTSSDSDDNIVVEKYEMPTDGTIEKAWLRNYIGHDFDLRYDIKIKTKEGRERSLFGHLGKEFITGDDDVHEFDLREELEAGDEIILTAENTETQYLYHANVRVSIDYEKGLIGALGRLF